MAGWQRILIVLSVASLLATLGACDDPPTAPPPTLDLTGTWSGQVGQPGSTSALRLTWVATHSGDTVSGIATLVKPAFNVEARGVMTARVTGDRLVLVYSVLPDSIPGFAACEIIGFGNATATNSTMTGGIGLTFRSCAGTGLEPPASADLRLTK